MGSNLVTFENNCILTYLTNLLFLNLTYQGDRRHYRRRDITSSHLTGTNAENRLLCVPLLQAERAWAHAMQLRQEANTEPRKKFHLVSRLKKACSHAHMLLQLCEVNFEHGYFFLYSHYTVSRKKQGRQREPSAKTFRSH